MKTGQILQILFVLLFGFVASLVLGGFTLWPMVLVPWALISGPMVWLLLRRHARAA